MKNSKALTCILVTILFLNIFNVLEGFKFPKIKIGGGKDAQKVITGLGIILLIQQFGGALNSFINTILLNHGAANRDATKVVPILTLGQGIEAGACQVSGPQEAVNRVKVVLSLAATFDKGHRFNIQALVPSGSMNPLKLDRVHGVGITAIIDYRL